MLRGSSVPFSCRTTQFTEVADNREVPQLIITIDQAQQLVVATMADLGYSTTDFDMIDFL